jgi:amidohydrolase
MNSLLTRVKDLFPYTRDLRREFHRQPELGFQEFKTAEIISRELSRLEGFNVQTGVAGTGLVGVLEGQRSGKTVLLRFDMDALPVTETTGLDFASAHQGLMHACGHDGHMAIGLTVCRLLSESRQELSGRIKVVFQPAEEGLGGAARMIQEGVLRDPAPDQALALHLWNEKPLGWLGISNGPVMSASDSFQIAIQGRGGHAALPQETADPVLAAAAVITALQSLVSREVSPLDSAVVSVCTLHGGEAHNVIPGRVQLSGTIRSFANSTRERLLERFKDVVEGVVSTHRCQAVMEFKQISPAVMNDPKVAELMRQAARELFPAADLDPGYRTMVSEDMAYFLREIPGCFLLIGSANPEKGLTASHHQPNFTFDEDAMITGSALLVGGAMRLLQD